MEHPLGLEDMSEQLYHSLDLDIYSLAVEPQFRWQHAVWLVFLMIELLLAARLLMQLYVPYPVGVLETVAATIVSGTDFLQQPVAFILGISRVSVPTSEWVTVFAILFYWLLVAGVLAWFKTSQSEPQIEVARAYSKRKYGY